MALVVVTLSSFARIFGRMLYHSFPACAFFFFFKWRSARAHKFHSLCQHQSTMAQRAETTVAECSLTSCVWIRFRIGFRTMPWQRHSQTIPTSLDKSFMRVTCHLHFWQKDRGLLCTTAVTRGWNGHRIRVSTQSWLMRRKFSRRSCQDSNSQPLDHESGALIIKLSRLHKGKVPCPGHRITTCRQWMG